MILILAITLKVILLGGIDGDRDYSYTKEDARLVVAEVKERVGHQFGIRVSKRFREQRDFTFPEEAGESYYKQIRARLRTVKKSRKKLGIKRNDFLLVITPSLKYDFGDGLVPSFGGIATICGHTGLVHGYSCSDPKCSAYLLYALLHELGHNFGSHHTSSGIMRGDVLSLVQGNPTIRIGYSPQSKREMICIK